MHAYELSGLGHKLHEPFCAYLRYRIRIETRFHSDNCFNQARMDAVSLGILFDDWNMYSGALLHNRVRDAWA
jgi:hypothetical protein